MSNHDPSDRNAQPLPVWPSFAEDEVAAAAAVLRSGKVNYWTGNEGRAFEREFAAYIGCSHAVAVANGTVALESALRALGVDQNHEVILPSRSYFATASAIVAVGARPIFADVDRDSQNVTATTIRAVINARTKAIIVVHLAGWPCEMIEILDLAKEFGVAVIEDCAQAHGATLRGQKVGSFGEIGCFSFCQDKIMTTGGEGGMVTTNSAELWERMWSFKDHGKSYDRVYNTVHAPGFRWLHASFGTNWRLTEVQAAIGRVQLAKLPDWLASRRHHAAYLSARLSRIEGLRIPSPPADLCHAFYKFYVFVNELNFREGWGRDRVAQEISRHGIPCTTGSCSELYLEPAFPEEWRPAKRLPVARELGETALMFQVHPTLETSHLDQICEVVEQVMTQAVVSRNSTLIEDLTAVDH